MALSRPRTQNVGASDGGGHDGHRNPGHDPEFEVPKNGRGKDDHIYCFVPGENIGVIVLASYLKSFVDATATIMPARHPRDSNKLGFTVGARTTLTRESLEDMMEDSRSWDREQKSDEFEAEPYDYKESDAWLSRKRKGSSKGFAPPVVQHRSMPTRRNPRNPATFSEVSAAPATAPETYSATSMSSEHRSNVSVDSGYLSSTPPGRAAPVQPKDTNRKPITQATRHAPEPDPDVFDRSDVSASDRYARIERTAPGSNVPVRPAAMRHDPDPNPRDQMFSRKVSQDPYRR